MKSIRSLPAGYLDSYRADNPADAAATGEQAKSAWNRFRDHADYATLRDELLRLQQGLCAYCEQRLISEAGELNKLDQQVEHVLAKSGGPGRVLDPTNLVVCCGGGTYAHHSDSTRYMSGKNQSCGQTKGDRELDPGCDPRGFPCAPPLVDIDLNGTLLANASACRASGINPAALEHTINDILNLNCERLRVARQKVASNVRGWTVPLIEMYAQSRHLTPAMRQQFKDTLVAERLHPDELGYLRAFWTTERRCLEPWSEDWLARNAHIFGCTAAADRGAPP